MKTKIILLSLLAISPIAWANETARSNEDNLKICTQVQELATVLMQARQEGHSMSKMMSVSDNKVAREILIDAYDSPRFNVPANQKKRLMILQIIGF